ncbi:chaperonin 10-like protein [Mucidula mucida]|nr:chaperonin 10-like protein [Mucidula mucida]
MSLPQNIQALVTKQSGGTDRTVEVQTIPFGDTLKIKTLAPNEIVVKIKAIGLNPTDWKLTIGPWSESIGSGKVVGHDAAGDVIRVGANVQHLKVGDRAACQQFGCYYSDTGSFAEYSRFDSALVFKLPDDVSYQAGAALPGPHYTAMQALYGRLKFPFPSDGNVTVDGNILIWGASTACGHQAVQLARLAGLQVIATASSRNHAAILSLGAIACEDYKDPKIVAKLKAAANGNPIKFAIDCVGTDGSSDRVVEAMSPGGHLISIMPASDTAEASAKEKDIKVEMILAGTLGGQEFFLEALGGQHVPAIPEDRVLISRWTEKELPTLLEKGMLKAPKLRLMPGGLEDVLQGLEIMKSGAYSAEKLVYTLK